MYEIKIGTPKVAGTEITSASASGLKTVMRPGGVAMMGSDYGEARLSKVEKVLNEVNLRVAEMEDTTEDLRSDISEIKEAVSRMEVTMDEVEDMKVGYASMEKTMRELSALYDLISGYTNPFVDTVNLPPRNGSDMDIAFGDEQEAPQVDVEKISEDINPFVDMGEKTEAPTPEPEEEKVEEPVSETEAERFKREAWMLKWAQFLLGKVRPRHIPELLAYYRSLNWIDAETEVKMLDYLEGSKMIGGDDDMEGDTIITEDGKVIKDSDPEAWKLSVEDHSKSLEYIENITGRHSP